MNEQTKPVEGSAVYDPRASYAEPVIDVDGDKYMKDAGGKLVPIGIVKPQDKLEDQAVRKIIFYAEDLHNQIARFRGHTFDDVAAFVDLLAETYDASRGGAKGNVTLTSYDGTLKVVVQVQEQLTFGPELEVAKGLVDECIRSWAKGSNDEIRALVEHAFQVDKHGQINRSELFKLRSLDIKDQTWGKAMNALSDAIRVIGSKEYVRFYKRETHRDKWRAVTIDLAKS